MPEPELLLLVKNSSVPTINKIRLKSNEVAAFKMVWAINCLINLYKPYYQFLFRWVIN